MIQDSVFTADGELYYPSESDVEGSPDPSVLPEFFGDVILVNGQAWPVMDVEPTVYRLRLLLIAAQLMAHPARMVVERWSHVRLHMAGSERSRRFLPPPGSVPLTMQPSIMTLDVRFRHHLEHLSGARLE